ncbi:hypothetical protein NQ314_003355 [Rhamnusium bicolor]|uniref:Uncharacterized protein n=1 Tax=Rhamnusium bicolor TaxID=1586634 RepID=A0AAV8ZNG3_9CUCU|nr:hypothetical protein NQ314_003355 [Rhamnusium bicolor]
MRGSVNTIINPPTPNQNFNQQPPQHQQSQVQQSQQPQPQQQQQQNNAVFTTISNFSPNSSTNYVNANSGNAQPGYPQVNNSSPQLVSHNSSGYPGQDQYGGQSHQWQNEGQIIWEQQVKMEPNYDHQQEQQNHQYMQQDANVNNSPSKMDPMHNEVQSVKTFSQADKVNLNTRIKTMILNKQQENKIEESKPVEQNTTGHFLWYSHHHHLSKSLSVDGGSQNLNLDLDDKTNRKFHQANHNLGHITHKGIEGYRNKNMPQESYQMQYERSIGNNTRIRDYYIHNQRYVNKSDMQKQPEIPPRIIQNVPIKQELHFLNKFAQNVKAETQDNEYNMCHNMLIKQERLTNLCSPLQDYKKPIPIGVITNFPPVSKNYPNQNQLPQNLSTNNDCKSYLITREQKPVFNNSRNNNINYQSPQISSNVNHLKNKYPLDQKVHEYRNSYKTMESNSETNQHLIPQNLTTVNGFKNHCLSVESAREQRRSPPASFTNLTPKYKNFSNQPQHNLLNMNGVGKKIPNAVNGLKHKMPLEIINPKCFSPDLKPQSPSLLQKKNTKIFTI